MNKIAILSNVNMDPIKSQWEKAGLGAPYLAPFGQYMQQLIDEKSNTNHTDNHYIWLHLDAEEFLKDNYYQLPDEQKIIDSFETLLSVAGKWTEQNPNKILIISSFVFPSHAVINFLDFNSTYSFSRIENEFTRLLQNFVLSCDNVLQLDFHRIVKQFGFDALSDEKYWYLGRIKYTELGFAALFQEFNALIRAHEGKSCKLLVCDLDNVLWGGIVGEEGPTGIILSEEGVGKVFRDFQKTLKALKKQGVLLAINSKNNENDVKEVFEKNSMMILTWDDFIVTKVNWNSKSDNLFRTASDLNIGLDSMVMIDDSAQERHMIRKALPQVIVPEFPQNIALLKKWLIRDVVYPYFGKTKLTVEDKNKEQQYKSKIKRDSLSKKLDIGEYIKSLNIQLDILKNSDNDLERIAQLTQKTNQFNLTTKRYQAHEIKALITNGEAGIYGLRYRDQFGDEGVVGAAIVRYAADIAAVDTFLLSCRILGRDVEFQFMQMMLTDLAQNGISELLAEFIPTTKNNLAEKFFVQCGFDEIESKRYKAQITRLIRKMNAATIK
ncbi:MAG: HAD-IIIC family phosphatase [Candidatus Omnitrophica bacterium]|nr:HAD-IIIC family phosphatase [Candidatus Omnitrophota bacterium]